MTLDNEETELALLALWHLKADATNQADGTGGKYQVGGAAWRCCKHVAAKCEKLIKRIEQWQTDVENGDARD